MNHHHSHDHNHDHHETKELTFKEKLKSLFQHWIDHNVSHKESYLSWAKKAEKENLMEIVSCLEQAGELSDKMNLELEKALKKID
jgi:rubrerythrin